VGEDIPKCAENCDIKFARHRKSAYIFFRALPMFVNITLIEFQRHSIFERPLHLESYRSTSKEIN